MVIHGSGICSSWKHGDKQNASQWVRHNVVHPCGIPCLNKKEVFIYQCMCIAFIGLPRWLSGKKESAGQCRRHRRPEFDPWIGKILWGRKWQPTPVLLPGKSHEQRSMVGYSPWGRKESDMTERLPFHFSLEAAASFYFSALYSLRAEVSFFLHLLKYCNCCLVLSCVQLFATQWTVAHQAPL